MDCDWSMVSKVRCDVTRQLTVAMYRLMNNVECMAEQVSTGQSSS